MGDNDVRAEAELDDATSIGRFAARVRERHGADVSDYRGLHQWSVDEPELFWAEVWQHFDVVASRDPESILDSRTMPGAQWFGGSRLNYVDQVTRHLDVPTPAVVSFDESGARRELSWRDLLARVAAFAAELRSSGVEKGDRVVGYLPNSAEAVIAFLGTASIGAVWACCGPDYGAAAAAERLEQLQPRVLVASTGNRFGGRFHDRRAALTELAQRLGVAKVVVVDSPQAPDNDDGGPCRVRWADVVDSAAPSAPPLETEQVPPGHPLWVLFSSGTTGKPKGIVHSHAGIVVTHLELFGLQMDLDRGDVFFWYTTTNWMLWNIVAGALLAGVTTITYEGSPAVPTMDRLWDIVADEGVRVFGTSPGHLQACLAQDIHPRLRGDFTRLTTVAVTGAPMSEALDDWVALEVSATATVVSSSGGTDVASSFVGGAPGLRPRKGVIHGPILGVSVAAYDDAGVPVRDTVGELVVTLPTPSMPIGLWGDDDGTRYRESYFETYPGVWRHGDWVTHFSDGTFLIHGRSDSTLNRNGVRIGSADLYNVVERHPAVAESMVVGVECDDGRYRMPMFLVANTGHRIDDTTLDELRRSLREEASPRHVPDEFHVVPAIPHTKTGKKIEVPVKRILQGAEIADVCAPGSIDRPELLSYYSDLALEWRMNPRPSTP
jgi:acetoacetyl-CoA synthetase